MECGQVHVAPPNGGQGQEEDVAVEGVRSLHAVALQLVPLVGQALQGSGQVVASDGRNDLLNDTAKGKGNINPFLVPEILPRLTSC